MNKKQLIVMWIGIALMVFFWFSAPRAYTEYLVENSISLEGGHVIPHEEGATYTLVQPATLFANWILVGAITSAMIITLKGKQPKDEQKQ